jgi:Domain of unknown function (DUF4105)
MWPRLLSGWGAFVVTFLVALCVTRHAAALEAPSRVAVLTMGPGDHPFTRFGHNAILLEWDDGGRGKNAVYNFGTFEFDGLHGVSDFMAGRFRYWLSVSSLEATVRAYAADKRSLTAQQLALTAAERAELYRVLADNALPEHRYYDYDYYRDNCSTRVRDALDHLLAGSLQRSVVGPGRLTFRQHTLALVSDTPWLYFGLDLALGAPTDYPTTRWQELFLPQELHDALARASREQDGQQLPLVQSETQLLSSVRPPLPQAPPTPWLAFGGSGTALGGVFVVLGRGARSRRAWRVLFGAATALLGLALGLLGVALSTFWASKHWAAHANRSLLACPPWALGLVVLGIGFALAKPRAARPLLLLLRASLASAGLLLLLSCTPGAHESWRMAALFLPLWAGWLWGAQLAKPAT